MGHEVDPNLGESCELEQRDGGRGASDRNMAGKLTQDTSILQDLEHEIPIGRVKVEASIGSKATSSGLEDRNQVAVVKMFGEVEGKCAIDLTGVGLAEVVDRLSMK